MVRTRLTDKAMVEMENRWKLEHRALDIFQIIVSEFESDPTSVQCFDLRIVYEAKQIARKLRTLKLNHDSRQE